MGTVAAYHFFLWRNKIKSRKFPILHSNYRLAGNDVCHGVFSRYNGIGNDVGMKVRLLAAYQFAGTPFLYTTLIHHVKKW